METLLRIAIYQEPSDVNRAISALIFERRPNGHLPALRSLSGGRVSRNLRRDARIIEESIGIALPPRGVREIDLCALAGGMRALQRYTAAQCT